MYSALGKANDEWMTLALWARAIHYASLAEQMSGPHSKVLARILKIHIIQVFANTMVVFFSKTFDYQLFFICVILEHLLHPTCDYCQFYMDESSLGNTCAIYHSILENSWMTLISIRFPWLINLIEVKLRKIAYLLQFIWSLFEVCK